MMRNDALCSSLGRMIDNIAVFAIQNHVEQSNAHTHTHIYTYTRGIVSRVNEWQRKERIDHEPSIMDEVCGSNFPFG